MGNLVTSDAHRTCPDVSRGRHHRLKNGHYKVRELIHSDYTSGCVRFLPHLSRVYKVVVMAMLFFLAVLVSTSLLTLNNFVSMTHVNNRELQLMFPKTAEFGIFFSIIITITRVIVKKKMDINSVTEIYSCKLYDIAVRDCFIPISCIIVVSCMGVCSWAVSHSCSLLGVIALLHGIRAVWLPPDTNTVTIGCPVS